MVKDMSVRPKRGLCFSEVFLISKFFHLKSLIAVRVLPVFLRFALYMLFLIYGFPLSIGAPSWGVSWLVLRSVLEAKA